MVKESKIEEIKKCLVGKSRSTEDDQKEEEAVKGGSSYRYWMPPKC